MRLRFLRAVFFIGVFDTVLIKHNMAFGDTKQIEIYIKAVVIPRINKYTVHFKVCLNGKQ